VRGRKFAISKQRHLKIAKVVLNNPMISMAKMARSVAHTGKLGPMRAG